MKMATFGPDQRKAFQGKSWRLLAVMALFFIGLASNGQVADSVKYGTPISVYGGKHKRIAADSVLLIPLSTSSHSNYRKGGIRYNPTDSSFEYFTGFQWLKSSGGAATNGIDTAYLQDDSLIVIETAAETYVIPVRTRGRISGDTLFVGTDTLLLPVADGAETKILPGANITIIGEGTTDIPYQLFVPFFLEDIEISNDTLYYYLNGSRWFGGKIPNVGGGSPNLNVGAGYRIAVSGTNNIKTLFRDGTLTMDSTTNTNGITVKVDTSVIATQHDLSQIPSGESNTISSVGTGTSIVKGKTGVDLRVKSITSDATVSITGNTDDVNIKADTSVLATQHDITQVGGNIQQTLTRGDTTTRAIVFTDAGDSAANHSLLIERFVPANFGLNYGGGTNTTGVFSRGMSHTVGVNIDGRPNVVYDVFDYNVGPGSAALINPDEAGLRIGIETHFVLSGEPAFETHIPEIILPGGFSYRPNSIYASKTGRNAVINSQASAWNWFHINDGAVQDTSLLSFDPLNHNIGFLGNGAFRLSNRRVPSNEFSISLTDNGPIIGGTSVTSPPIMSIMNSITTTTAYERHYGITMTNDNSYGLYFDGSSTANSGYTYPIYAHYSSPGGIIAELMNQHATGAGALVLGSTQAGDGITVYRSGSNGSDFAMGYNAASNSFRMTSGASALLTGGTNVATVLPNGRWGLGGATSPGFMLHVAGTGYFGDVLHLKAPPDASISDSVLAWRSIDSSVRKIENTGWVTFETTTTDNATYGLIIPQSSADSTVYDIEFICVAILDNGDGAYASKKIRSVLHDASGDLHFGTIRSPQPDDYMGTGLSTATATIDDNVFGDIELQYIGETGKNIHWKFQYRKVLKTAPEVLP